MHGILTIAQKTYKKIRDCKAVNYGEESNHADVSIKLYIKYIKFEHSKVIKGDTDWTRIATDEGCTASYSKTLKSLAY